MECPSCQSTNLQKLSVIYNSGLFDVRASSAGIIGGGFYIHRGTRQSRLSQIAAPPRRRSDLRVALLWLLGSCLLAVTISEIRPQALDQAGQNYHGPKQAMHKSGAMTRHPSTAVDHFVAVALFLLLAILLARVYRHNRYIYPSAIQRWNSSFMCRRCGAIAEIIFRAGG
jgi:hypothetical protein